MANPEHLAILKQSVDAWNHWRSTFSGTPDLRGADLSGAFLSGAFLNDTLLVGATLNNALLTRALFRHALLSGADLTNATLICAELVGARLDEANLRGANLHGSSLSSADLSAANLSAAKLSLAEFTDANLRGANLHSSDMSGAKLKRTDLRAVNLEYANLVGTEFVGTNLDGTTFSFAHLGATTFVDCDLSKTKGLDITQHHYPSGVGIETIYKSAGIIPDSFLRGCGVPENLIRYIPSLVNSEDGIQFYSCFISYSSKDEDFARRLHGKMRDAHLRVWFAPEDIQGGQKLHEQIETAIRIYDKLLIVLSEASLQSEWVMTELRKARKAERQSGKRKLFPVRLVDMETLRDWECFDADSGKDLAVELREYFIPDFSHWKEHDPFEAAFARLLKDLKSDASAA